MMSTTRCAALLSCLLVLVPACAQTIVTGSPVASSEAEPPTLETIDDAVAAYGIPTRLAYDEDGARTLVYTYDMSKGRGLAIGFPVWSLLAFVHRHRGFDRLEIKLDADHQVVDSQLVIVNDGYERRLNPFWDGEE